MALDFLSSATGNPINLKRRIAFQSTRGIPPTEARGGGILTFTGVTSDTETVVIGADTYEFDSGGGVTGGRIAVDISGGATASASVTALVAAINASGTEAVTAFDGAGDSVVVYADYPGATTAATTTTCVNATWADATLVGDAADPYVDFRAFGGPFDIEPTEIERMALGGSGIPLKSLPGKTNTGGGPLVIGDADPANKGLLRGLANVFGKYTTASAGGATYYTHSFNLGGATSADSFLAIINDNNVGPRMRGLEFMFGGVDISASPGSNLEVSFPFQFGEYDFHGVPYQTVGTGTTPPMFKRTWSGNWSPDDKAIWCKAKTDNGATWVFQFKIGTAAAYSAETTVYEGKWSRIKDESGNLIGAGVGDCVLMYVPTSWGGAANDEFVVPQNRIGWTESLNTERPISSVDTIWVLDGTEIRVEGGWNISFSWDGFNSTPDTAGRQGSTIDRDGELNCIITPTRRIINLDLQKAIEQASTVSCYIDAYTRSTISGTSPLRPYRMLVAVPEANVYGKLYDPDAGARNRDESPRIVAGKPSAAGSYQGPYDAAALSFPTISHAYIWIENDLATF